MPPSATLHLWSLSSWSANVRLHVLLAGRPDPAWYYEQVPPSEWQPPAPDTCMELYRRAYCSEADVAFPVLWFISLVGLCWAEVLPLWGLLALAAVLFVGGTQLFIVTGEAVLRRRKCEYCLR